MGSWTNVAALLRAKTNEGGLSVKPTEGLPFLLEKGMEVTFVPPVLRIPRSGKVLDVEEIAEGRYMVWFDCIDNRTDAEKLEGISAWYVPPVYLKTTWINRISILRAFLLSTKTLVA